MIALPKSAMVLAAGLGTRLRPLTEDRPKALVEVGGQTLIDRCLDRLQSAGVERAVINLHWHAGRMRNHLAKRLKPEIVYSDESKALLETGGGTAQALPLLGSAPFFVVNCDIIWRDSGADSLARLAARFDEEAMDALLLVTPTVGAVGYSGMGDMTMAPDGRLARRDLRTVAPFVFTGVQILHPRLFDGAPGGAYSLVKLYDKAAAAGRLFGLRHEGDWMDIGSHTGLAAAQTLFGG